LPSFEQALSLIKFLDVEGEMTGSGVRVVFIDSGCGRGLPLRDCINLTESSDVDTEGHGSAVHAVLASMLPDAEIYLVKVPDPLPDHVLITALNEAHKLLPHAINLSITSEIPSDGSDPASTYVNHIASRSVVAVAAGNGGPRMMSIGSPAVAGNAVTVGATDLRGRLWKRSSRGPTLDGRWKPNIVAPTGYRPAKHVAGALRDQLLHTPRSSRGRMPDEAVEQPVHGSPHPGAYSNPCKPGAADNTSADGFEEG
jgi:hypothetical protein